MARELKRNAEPEIIAELGRLMRKYPELSTIKVSRGKLTRNFLITVTTTDHYQVNFLADKA